MKRYPRGSEWRKWDLHVHPPGTKLSNNYPKGSKSWDRFCKTIHDSDVFVVGITDYFSFDGFFEFIKEYKKRYPDSEKIFFPNLELRLNEAVNEAGEEVHLHLVFRPDLPPKTANEFLANLNTELTDSKEKPRSCASLSAKTDYESASVSRTAVKEAIEATFGRKADPTEHLIIIVAANNDGIRPPRGKKRKAGLSDETDKLAHGCFGHPGNVDYFLRTDRLEDSSQKATPKPVFCGCDAHSHEELEAWLGNEVSDKASSKHVMWIKADPTFEGLQQTLIEPTERVRIQTLRPDEKEPYKVISRIVFKDPKMFPGEVLFNPGLNAIIGSRSSGKSALLAYIAHAVDPEGTVERQAEASGRREDDTGPGAGITWSAVEDIEYQVEWAQASATSGRIIYIPQNSLYAISERPDDITAQIEPAVYKGDPEFESALDTAVGDVQSAHAKIRRAVDAYFTLFREIGRLNKEVLDIGDQAAIQQRKVELEESIKRLRKASRLSQIEVDTYQKLSGQIRQNEERLSEIDDESRQLAPYLKQSGKRHSPTDKVSVSVEVVPNPESVPDALGETLRKLRDEAETPLVQAVGSAIADYRAGLDKEKETLSKANAKIAKDNKSLFDKSAANEQLTALVEGLEEQEVALRGIGQKQKAITAAEGNQAQAITEIEKQLARRDKALDELVTTFGKAKRQIEEMSLLIELGYDDDKWDEVSAGFNKRAISDFKNDKRIDLSMIQSDIAKFVRQMADGTQKVNQGQDSAALTKDVLTFAREIRFAASLEGDRIGGFARSTMTPGKQALFALILILAQSDEPWPLLIDQPEDDLDSRSVCDVIVRDLMKRKRERQIIMVTHDANLAIGADSEEIIVANRHGDDRPNRDKRYFEYLTGSLEHSQDKDPAQKYILESAGIREHACEILDGGAEAFKKRKSKYRI